MFKCGIWIDVSVVFIKQHKMAACAMHLASDEKMFFVKPHTRVPKLVQIVVIAPNDVLICCLNDFRVA